MAAGMAGGSVLVMLLLSVMLAMTALAMLMMMSTPNIRKILMRSRRLRLHATVAVAGRLRTGPTQIDQLLARAAQAAHVKIAAEE
mmetsp:Transcript_24887/g.40676  ORF Transcript_24887/g.40676 Transcript_24887/m.40676 type:complete len:85 (-) Transcript_24887:84-338(-)